jgi:hypothetical protein
MRKALSITVAALWLSCNQPRPAQQPAPSEQAEIPEYNRVLKRVATISYTVQRSDSTLSLLESELRGSREFTPLRWPYFGLRSGVVRGKRESVCAYSLPQILTALNGREFRSATPLHVGERIIFPDLSDDRRINGQRGIYAGDLQFTGLLDMRGLPVPSEFSYAGRTYKAR